MDRTDQYIKKIIRAHGTSDPKKVTDRIKLMVFYEELGKNIWGYYTCLNRIPSIHINHRLNEFRTAFALGHELGHHILHKGVNTPFLRRNTLFTVDKIEREANTFSIKLLIGEDKPEDGETKLNFLLRCGIPEEFHVFY